MATEHPTALGVRGLTKSFGGLVAVDDMSFELAEHEVLGPIGPNGSGKTTMINLISGALKASRGEIVLFGENIASESAHAIACRGVARTFQLVRMLGSMSVPENVETGGVFGHARRWGAALRNHARHNIARVGLPARRTSRSRLSAGKRPHHRRGQRGEPGRRPVHPGRLSGGGIRRARAVPLERVLPKPLPSPRPSVPASRPRDRAWCDT